MRWRGSRCLSKLLTVAPRRCRSARGVASAATKRCGRAAHSLSNCAMAASCDLRDKKLMNATFRLGAGFQGPFSSRHKSPRPSSCQPSTHGWWNWELKAGRKMPPWMRPASYAACLRKDVLPSAVRHGSRPWRPVARVLWHRMCSAKIRCKPCCGNGDPKRMMMASGSSSKLSASCSASAAPHSAPHSRRTMSKPSAQPPARITAWPGSSTCPPLSFEGSLSSPLGPLSSGSGPSTYRAWGPVPGRLRSRRSPRSAAAPAARRSSPPSKAGSSGATNATLSAGSQR
mmetsp:Transcript_43877/g.126850  ORF Transcript_43877/g.126850 Transcript_43877/m.126850 type:complete len:286 (-) Transcript_43877:257-1114(-)